MDGVYEVFGAGMDSGIFIVLIFLGFIGLSILDDNCGDTGLFWLKERKNRCLACY